MLLNYYYWYFTKALSPKVCQRIISLSKRHKKLKAITGHSTKKITYQKLTNQQKLNLSKTRNSNIVWLNEPWLFELLQSYVRTANQNSGWNFQWERTESIQFTQYKKNQFYGWHQDTFPHPHTEGPLKGLIRKLSVIVSLTDENKYVGGDLEFDLRNFSDKSDNIITCKEIKPQGSIVVFPSHVWHRVKPVTKGTRQSLVMWNDGKPFV